MSKQIKVLDKGFVELLDMMPRPGSYTNCDMAIVNAARVSYLGASKGEEADKRLLFYLMRNRHTSPFEMVEFKFRVKAPLVVWWQWVRHRTWSFNAQSGRYTSFDEDDFYLPTEWRLQSKSNKQASDGLLDSGRAYHWTETLGELYNLSYGLYERMLEDGISREMARLALPGFATYYTWVCKVDAHNLMNFIRLRMANDAQYEIRRYAEVIYEEFFQQILPWTAEAFEKYVLGNNEESE